MALASRRAGEVFREGVQLLLQRSGFALTLVLAGLSLGAQQTLLRLVLSPLAILLARLRQHSGTFPSEPPDEEAKVGIGTARGLVLRRNAFLYQAQLLVHPIRHLHHARTDGQSPAPLQRFHALTRRIGLSHLVRVVPCRTENRGIKDCLYAWRPQGHGPLCIILVCLLVILNHAVLPVVVPDGLAGVARPLKLGPLLLHAARVLRGMEELSDAIPREAVVNQTIDLLDGRLPELGHRVFRIKPKGCSLASDQAVLRAVEGVCQADAPMAQHCLLVGNSAPSSACVVHHLIYGIADRYNTYNIVSTFVPIN